MFAMFGKLTATSGQRDELLEILLEAADVVGDVDGARCSCEHAHRRSGRRVRLRGVGQRGRAPASLEVEAVRSAISRAMPLLVGPPIGQLTLTPVGGLGMPEA